VFTIALIVVIGVYVSTKVFAVVRGPLPSAGSLALFVTVWPGVRIEPFATPPRADPAAARLVRHGGAVAAAGVVSWVALSRCAHVLPPGVVGWLGIGVILTTLHLGLSDVVTGGLRLAGYPVRRLFADPLTSRSLGEFWTSRWNAAFVEMNQLIVVPFLRRFLGRYARAGAFVVSGLLHELAISLPVRAGFGLPTLYFAIHALAISLEPRLGVRRWPSLPARMWTWSLLLAPLPLLFHQAFRDALVLPLFGGSS